MCAGGKEDRSGPDGKEKAAKMKMKEKLITKMKLPLLTALCAALTAFTAAACLQPAAAQTGIASTTKYNDLPVNHVKVEKLSMDKAQFSSTNSDIIMTQNWQIANENGGTTTKAVIYNSAVDWGTANATSDSNAKMTKNTVPGSFTLRWTDAAVLPDGTKADVIYTFSDWEFYLGERPDNVVAGAKVNVPILQGSTSVSYTTYNPRRGVTNTTGVATTIKQSVRTTVKIVKSGTQTAPPAKISSMECCLMKTVDSMMPIAASRKLEEMIRIATMPISVICAVISASASDSKMARRFPGKNMKISVPMSMMEQAQQRATLIQLYTRSLMRAPKLYAMIAIVPLDRPKTGIKMKDCNLK